MKLGHRHDDRSADQGRARRLGQAMIALLPALRRYAIGLCGNVAAADDLVQDCIERALRRLGSLQEEDRLAPWMRSILFHAFIDERRQARSRGEMPTAPGLEEVPDGGGGAELKEEVREVLTAAAALAPQQAQVLLLIGVEGMSYRQVAEELGLPIGTVMSRLSRARAELRAMLADAPDEGGRA